MGFVESSAQFYIKLPRFVTIEETTETSFEGVDIALFSAGGSTSAKYAPYAVKAGAVVVDNTSYFR